MQFIAVIAAALASYAFGAIWYMVLAKPWMAVAGVSEEEVHRKDPTPFIIAFVSALLVAGMMRHVFAWAPVNTPGAGAMAGFGIGLFLATPWLATTYAFGGRPKALTLIDGGYVTIGCTIMGLVLTLF